MNIYELVDHELGRIHETLRQAQATMQVSRYNEYSGPPELAARLYKFHEVLLRALANRDEVIQEKVAEMALTGGDADV